MKITCTDIKPHCHSQPILDTWDEKESRSMYCPDCGLKTKSYFSRDQAYEEWHKITTKYEG